MYDLTAVTLCYKYLRSLYMSAAHFCGDKSLQFSSFEGRKCWIKCFQSVQCHL